MNECTLVLHRLRYGGKEMMNEWSALTVSRKEIRYTTDGQKDG